MLTQIKDDYCSLGMLTVVWASLTTTAYAECSLVESTNAKQMLCRYERYEVLVSCKYRMPLLSMLSIGRDIGHKNTSNKNYFLDEEATTLDCQQSSSNRYSQTNSEYEVGRLTAIDLLDDSQKAALQTNAMTNLVPQNKVMNRYGAWKRTETLVECYRDDINKPLGMDVLSGVLIGSDINNDHFTISHSLMSTPDYMWKLVYFKSENRYDAWIIKNSSNSLGSNLKSYRKTISKIIDELIKDNEQEQSYSLDRLKEILVKEPSMVELKFNSNCKLRIG